MKNIAIMVLGITLVGCAGNNGQTRYDMEVQKQELDEIQNEAIEEHIDEVPSWVIETRDADGVGVYGVGMGDSYDLNLAIKKARLEAEFNLAKAYSQELSGNERLYASEKLGLGSRYEGVIEKIVDKVPVVGYKIIEQEVKAIRGKYVVFVMMQLPYDQFNAILIQKKEAALSKDMEAAFKELERRLDKRMKENSKTSMLDKSIDKIQSITLTDKDNED